MRIPLHLDPSDHSQEASLRRVEHHVAMSGITRGKGFRVTTKNSTPTRIEKIGKLAFGDKAADAALD